MNNLPETPEEIDEFIRAVESGEIDAPPAPNTKIIARMCVMRHRINQLEQALEPFSVAADLVDIKCDEQLKFIGSRISENASPGWGIRRKHLNAARKVLNTNSQS